MLTSGVLELQTLYLLGVARRVELHGVVLPCGKVEVENGGVQAWSPPVSPTFG